MRRFTLLLPSLLLLAACGSQDVSLNSLLDNPLYAEVYWGDLAKRLANIEISKELPENKALLDDASRASALMKAKEFAILNAQQASDRIRSGAIADFSPVFEEPEGRVLLLDDVLYTAPYFNTPPGPSLHLYLSPLTDPRGGSFPDADALDLGELKQPYGSASYDVSSDGEFNTVVLYDSELQRVYGFAQLQRQ